MNVLIIDDDLGIRETLGMAIQTLGHTVAAVVNRAAAEKKLRAESFEVAFLDLRLGAESGLDLLPDLLRLSPRLAVIVITAYSSIETAVQAIQRGAFDYLAKPFKPTQIAQVLERVAKTRRLEVRISDLEGQLIKPRRRRRDRDQQRPGHEADLGNGAPGRVLQRLDSPCGRKRHGQERAGAADSSLERARHRAVHYRQLPQPLARAVRERALRPYQGRVHRRDRQYAGQGRGGGPRHPFPRRDRRAAARNPAQAAAAPAGAGIRARGRVETARLASQLNAEWYVVYVRTRKEAPDQIAAETHRRLTDTLEIAQKMGGTVVILKSDQVAEALTSFAKDYGITQTVTGKSRPRRGLRFGPSLVDRLSANLPGVDVILS